VHTFIGAPNGKSREAAHVTSESTPLSVLRLFFAEIFTLLVVETNLHCHQFVENSDDGPPEREVTEAEMFVFGCDVTDGTYSSRQSGGLLDENGKASHSILWTNDGTCYVLPYYGFYISPTIIGMVLTEQMTDCGKYETCLKL